MFVTRDWGRPRLERVSLRVSREGGRAGVCRQTACLRLDLDSTEQLCEDGKIRKMGLTTPILHRGGVLGGFNELIHVKHLEQCQTHSKYLINLLMYAKT